METDAVYNEEYPLCYAKDRKILGKKTKEKAPAPRNTMKRNTDITNMLDYHKFERDNCRVRRALLNDVEMKNHLKRDARSYSSLNFS